MGKKLFIAEKPSVAQEFAKALKTNFARRDGYLEAEDAVVTWCVGHLVTMSYPEVYDEKFRRWSLDTIPFIPDQFRYEVIPSVKKQFETVKTLLNREDVTTIYVCTDSGREGEYIYRLVEKQANVHDKERKRVWIDSQTEEEIQRGIREAKDESEYDPLSAAAFLRAKEDYLMGINFSRALTLKFGYPVKTYLKQDKCVVSVGRVMTCVLGMVVNREREIRNFVKTPFFRVIANIKLESETIEGEWRATEGSRYAGSPLLYKENGFLKEEEAAKLIVYLEEEPRQEMHIVSIEKKKEVKNPPLLYNLAELQNDCSRYFKISPDQTLTIIQELYEKKLCTYPRTDARVLSTAVAKEISKNISGLRNYPICAGLADQVLQSGSYKTIAKTKYTNDKQITDHYAIIPTGQGFQNLSHLNRTSANVFELIAKRFLGIFFPPAIYQKISLVTELKGEKFYSSFKILKEEGFLAVSQYSFFKDRAAAKDEAARKDSVPGELNSDQDKSETESEQEEENSCNQALLDLLSGLKKNAVVPYQDFVIRSGETSPPKRYNSGSMILTMENAGQFIEEEELRSQIKGSGIGTSATRAEILKKLVHNQYLRLNTKTQIITPTFLGETIYEVVKGSVSPLLDPRLTASWEKGLTKYMQKLDDFVRRRTNQIKSITNQTTLYRLFDQFSGYYK